jgi:hypothetical protein
MYASVEMLLKFYGEKFFFETDIANIRGKRASSYTLKFSPIRIPHLHLGYFTGAPSPDRILFASDEFSIKRIEVFCVSLSRAPVGGIDEAKTNDSLRR